MRVKPGSIAEVFHIHRMLVEYLKDTGQEFKHVEKSAEEWLYRFGAPNFFCSTLLHGKKYVGMSWGYLPYGADKKLRLEGIFIKRGFRGRVRAIKTLVNDLKGIIDASSPVGFSMIIPENLVKKATRRGFKVSGLLVEKEREAEKTQGDGK